MENKTPEDQQFSHEAISSLSVFLALVTNSFVVYLLIRQFFSLEFQINQFSIVISKLSKIYILQYLSGSFLWISLKMMHFCLQLIIYIFWRRIKNKMITVWRWQRLKNSRGISWESITMHWQRNLIIFVAYNTQHFKIITRNIIILYIIPGHNSSPGRELY